MKGPGVRIDIEVRRAWRCPVCGQNQRHTMDITHARCGCTREGVPMKLAEEQRPDRKALRPEVRAMLDRIQAGEQFPRMASTGGSDSDRPRGEGGDYRSNRRPPRRDHSDGPPRISEPPRELVSPAVVEEGVSRMRDASTTIWRPRNTASCLTSKRSGRATEPATPEKFRRHWQEVDSEQPRSVSHLA